MSIRFFYFALKFSLFCTSKSGPFHLCLCHVDNCETRAHQPTHSDRTSHLHVVSFTRCFSTTGTIWRLVSLFPSTCNFSRSRKPGTQGSFTPTTWHPLSANVGTNFADKRRRSVGIVRSWTQFSLVLVTCNLLYVSAWVPIFRCTSWSFMVTDTAAGLFFFS
jgi:hypothetical protein